MIKLSFYRLVHGIIIKLSANFQLLYCANFIHVQQFLSFANQIGRLVINFVWFIFELFRVDYEIPTFVRCITYWFIGIYRRLRGFNRDACTRSSLLRRIFQVEHLEADSDVAHEWNVLSPLGVRESPILPIRRPWILSIEDVLSSFRAQWILDTLGSSNEIEGKRELHGEDF